MALQNRVDPAGAICRHSARGLFMGNRGGPLHDTTGRIVRSFKTRAWIICLTEFKNRTRRLMQPGRYTELFFLDEAVALAAGHRPCFECRRTDALAFAAAMTAALADDADGVRPGISAALRLRAGAMDRLLHDDRQLPLDHPDRRLGVDQILALPDGSFVGTGQHYYLIRNGVPLRWSFEGYQPVGRLEAAALHQAQRITPTATIAALRAGYRPVLHPTALLAQGSGDTEA